MILGPRSKSSWGKPVTHRRLHVLFGGQLRIRREGSMQYDKGNFRISQHGRPFGTSTAPIRCRIETGRPLEGRPSISLDTESAHEIAVFGKSFHVRMQRFLGMAAEAQYAEV
jgi:hypothetical protein